MAELHPPCADYVSTGPRCPLRDAARLSQETSTQRSRLPGRKVGFLRIARGLGGRSYQRANLFGERDNAASPRIVKPQFLVWRL